MTVSTGEIPTKKGPIRTLRLALPYNKTRQSEKAFSCLPAVTFCLMRWCAQSAHLEFEKYPRILARPNVQRFQCTSSCCRLSSITRQSSQQIVCYCGRQCHHIIECHVMAGSHITASFPTKIIYIMLFPPELNNLQNIPHELSPYSMGSRESLSKFIVFFL